MSHEALHQTLVHAGWTMFPAANHEPTGVSWRACKKLVDVPDCRCNDRPPQVVVTPWCVDLSPLIAYSVEVSVCGETARGWVDLKFYGLSPDLVAIDAAAETLRLCWITAANTPKVETEDDPPRATYATLPLTRVPRKS